MELTSLLYLTVRSSTTYIHTVVCNTTSLASYDNKSSLPTAPPSLGPRFPATCCDPGTRKPPSSGVDRDQGMSTSCSAGLVCVHIHRVLCQAQQVHCMVVAPRGVPRRESETDAGGDQWGDENSRRKGVENSVDLEKFLRQWGGGTVRASTYARRIVQCLCGGQGTAAE
ncbi:hypothetical protein M3J09_007060 [Ascochyta lentis]